MYVKSPSFVLFFIIVISSKYTVLYKGNDFIKVQFSKLFVGSPLYKAPFFYIMASFGVNSYEFICIFPFIYKPLYTASAYCNSFDNINLKVGGVIVPYDIEDC